MRFLLVLSIAVLVLVLDWILRYTIGQQAPPCSIVESGTRPIRAGDTSTAPLSMSTKESRHER